MISFIPFFLLLSSEKPKQSLFSEVFPKLSEADKKVVYGNFMGAFLAGLMKRQDLERAECKKMREFLESKK